VRVFLTGASGFVGRWLTTELETSGHEVLGTDSAAGSRRQVDVTQPRELSEILRAEQPDAIVHLAAISSQPAAADDPRAAFEINVGGTLNLFEAVRAMDRAPSILVTGSSEVYGPPAPEELPLTETSPLRPRTIYALSKAAQESVALAYAARLDLPAVVSRSFNHTGPGQRPQFVVPALAQRILDVRDGRARSIPIGNTDVRRDFSDVRDVVRAYRLILETLADGVIERGGKVLNVCSGEAVTIRHIIELLCRAAEVEPVTRVAPELVRRNEPPEIRGDSRALRAAVDWQPKHSLDETLREVWQDVARTTAALPMRAKPLS
jgi:GDP-4-dehydro-6-deoxy-D-mannose reductase